MNRRKLLVTGLCAAAIVSLSSAGASAEEKIAPKTLEFLEATTISGYVEASFVSNVKADITNRNRDEGVPGGADVSGKNANHLRAFDDNIGFTLNAIKLVFEKPLGEGDWAAGYRADLLFGQDAVKLNQAEGSGNPNFVEGSTDGVGTYIEQGYVSFRLPIGNGLDCKFGRFVALSGYEVIESPANLNFSRGLLFTWASPLAHNGLLTSYRLNDMIDLQVGIVNGWNTWITDSEAPAIIARTGLRNASGTVSFAVSTYYGQARFSDAAFTAGAPTRDGERWFVDGVANWKPTEKLLIGAEAMVGSQKTQLTSIENARWFGFAGYVKFQVSDKVSIAGRAEYLNDEHEFLYDQNHASFDTTVGTLGGSKETQAISLTGTVNVDVWKNMLLRLEARWDQASFGGTGTATPAGYTANNVHPFEPKESQLTFAVDAVYSF